MGAKNVKTVYANWAHLRDGPFRLLVFMANTALDSDVEPRYWGGREALAIALGRFRRIAGGRTPEEEARERDAAYLAVKRALRQLKNSGAITTLNVAGPGTRSDYRLNLDGPPETNGPRSAEGTPRTPLTADSDPVNNPVRGEQPRHPTRP